MPGDCSRNWKKHAALRLWLGSFAGAGSGRFPQIVRPHDSRTLRDDRNADEISNPYDGERRPGSVGLASPGVQTQIVGPEGERRLRWGDGRIVSEGCQCVRRILAARTTPPAPLSSTDGLRPGIWRKIRPTATTRCRAPQRSHYLGRLQHLSARDRRVPHRATGIAEAAVAGEPDLCAAKCQSPISSNARWSV